MTCLKEALTGFAFVFFILLAVVIKNTSADSAKNEDWSAWKHHLPIRLASLTESVSRFLPIDVRFTLKASLCPHPEKEIRLVYRTPGGADQEVPFQLSRLRVWNKGLDPKVGEPTLNGILTFFDVSNGDRGGTYVLLYGNPDAKPPAYPTDLSVRGEWPAWVIENSRIKVELRKGDPVKPEVLHDVFGDCGQIASVSLKSSPDIPISNRYRTLHWNPGVLIPERGWSNAHAWDPPEKYELEKGPLFVEIRRSGPLPLVPEIELAITYRIFAGRDYVWYGATLRAKEDIGVVSLRTNELVFDEGFFSRLAWENEGKINDRPLADMKPANMHGDILRLPPGAPFLAAYDRQKGVGAASITLAYSIVDPHGRIPDCFDHAFLAVKGTGAIGSGGLFFWFRSFVNFAPEWDRRERLILPAGWVCAEQSLFHFFSPGESNPLRDVVALSRAARDLARLDIQVGPHPFATPGQSNREKTVQRTKAPTGFGFGRSHLDKGNNL